MHTHGDLVVKSNHRQDEDEGIFDVQEEGYVRIQRWCKKMSRLVTKKMTSNQLRSMHWRLADSHDYPEVHGSINMKHDVVSVATTNMHLHALDQSDSPGGQLYSHFEVPSLDEQKHYDLMKGHIPELNELMAPQPVAAVTDMVQLHTSLSMRRIKYWRKIQLKRNPGHSTIFTQHRGTTSIFLRHQSCEHRLRIMRTNC